MKVTPEQIERFFKKQCADDEAARVAEFLKSNPTILEYYLRDAEWNETETELLVPDNFWDEVWDTIQKKKRLSTPAFWLKHSAVAACIALTLFSGYYLVGNKTAKDSKNIRSEDKSGLAATIQRKRVEKTSAKKTGLLLRDGSLVTLYPHSVISYDVPFASDRREVFLEGEAVFTVADDKTRPFTVYAGNLATTALGTEFKVTCVKQKPLTIKLFKGKVVIRSAKEHLEGFSRSIYLHPGEQMEYDLHKKLVAVTGIDNHVLSRKSVSKVSNKKISVTGTNSLVFNSTPLPEVMDKLGLYFNKKIRYKRAQVNTMNFTGTITKSDSLSVVLRLIGQMNNLGITQQGDGFIVDELQEQNNDYFKE